MAIAWLGLDTVKPVTLCRAVACQCLKGIDGAWVRIVGSVVMILQALVTVPVLAKQAPAATQPALEIATVLVPAGDFIVGSDRAEREAAYRLDEAGYGHSVTRRQRWYENEPARRTMALPAFRMMKTVVTNALYRRFVMQTGHRAPRVDRTTWNRYGLIHPYRRTLQFQWTGQRPMRGREHHPVVLVSRADAQAFARWLSDQTARRWQLPSEAQWEKAARGTDGRYFPWGNGFDPTRLNSHDRGPFTTVPAGQYANGASPFGLLDAAGQVFEWTRTRRNASRSIVKGGSWDDTGCGVCRPAARHARPDDIKHILIGFRLVTDADP